MRTLRMMQLARRGFTLALLVSLASCGGSAHDVPAPTPNPTPSGPNVVAVTVDGGPAAAAGSVNTLYTTVTVCVPGSTTQCQAIDHIQVDTGSEGLRILSSVLTLALPIAQTSTGATLVECTQFVDGYSWGPVAAADVQIGGETASSMPVQVIGGSSLPVPPACSATGIEEDTVETFGANGILGIGVFAQDCGAGCVNGNTQPAPYYTCSSVSCSPVTVSLLNQVPNPVTSFAADNNGTFIELPSVAAGGAATLTGSLIFGIDTQTNNASGSQTVLTVDPNLGEFTTTYNGQPLAESFIDSGSNGYFFNDSTIPVCTNADFSGFYCPSTTLNLSGVLKSESGTGSATVNFSVANAQTVGSQNPTFAVLPELGGTYSSSPDSFDWGLPFFYGRTVITAIEQHTTKVGTGPYVAF
jgi:hypothetical protein